jgi:glycosyltransferase involved in cell wall biosynthesis
MKKLIEDATLYEYFSKEGIDYVKHNFSSKRIAEQYVELYQKILKKTAP